MTKIEKYKNAVSIIKKLKKSTRIIFSGIKDMHVKDSDNYQGIMALVEYIKQDYVLIAYADRDKEIIKLDIDLLILPDKEAITKVLSYLITVNLLIDYDAVFRLSQKSVHIFADISFNSIKDFHDIERAIICLLDIQEVYRETIRAIANRRHLPMENAEAYMSYQSILCNSNALIAVDKKVSLTEVHGRITDTFSYFRYKRFSKKEEDQKAEFFESLKERLREEIDDNETEANSHLSDMGDS